ncbi:MAG: creatininase family protein [Clostridia bacterium]|nr:creatininase family protein [Clostridia bacterium]
MYLSRMNILEVQSYLKKSDAVLIPVGSLENHGLHMPLGTDAMIPDEIARLLNEKSDLLIAPTINYGATDGLSGYPGTVSIGTEGLTHLLKAVCDQLYLYGFRHFIILNGHGGNNAAIQDVGMHLYRKGAYLANLNWWLMAGQLNPEWAGGHGGGEETAAIMAVDESLIKKEYLHLPENYKNDLGDSLPYAAWQNVSFKGATVTVFREIKDISDNGWLVHSCKGDVPSRADKEWGREMLIRMADWIADFEKEFSKTKLPENHA